MRSSLFALMFAGLVGTTLVSARAADNQLTAAEKQEGWQLLFDGRDATGWITSNGKQPPESVVEDGTLVPYRSGGYLLVYEKPFGDFILKCDVKMPKTCNSGIFFRVGDLAHPVQTGLEAQILNTQGTGMHDFGAIYDLVAPKKNNLKPTGEWNSVTITCRGPRIQVAVNGETVTEMNSDEWTQPGRRLDGSRHKFAKAIKDFPRKGHLGFQDHGHKVWFKNIKLKPLDSTTSQ